MYWQVAQGKSRLKATLSKKTLIMLWLRDNSDRHYRKSGKILNPRTIDKDGNIVYVPIDDWCSGFFPGNIWHMYELTGDQKWLPLAEKYTGGFGFGTIPYLAP